MIAGSDWNDFRKFRIFHQWRFGPNFLMVFRSQFVLGNAYEIHRADGNSFVVHAGLVVFSVVRPVVAGQRLGHSGFGSDRVRAKWGLVAI